MENITKTFKGDSFACVYEKLLHEVYYNPEFECAPRSLKIKEITNVHLIVNNTLSNLFKNNVRNFPYNYLAGEFLWYFFGKNDVDFISKYSKFWKKIANKDGTCNSAYGYQLCGIKNEHGYTEWEWAKQSLLSSKDSRQAIMRFNKQSHSFDGNLDFVCTLNGVFQIRNDELNLFINMRSSDCIKGLTFDFPFFSMLQQAMLLELQDKYTSLKLGKIELLLNSSHIYENDFDLVENMLKSKFEEDKLPIMSKNLIGLTVNEIINSDDMLSQWINEHA